MTLYQLLSTITGILLKVVILKDGESYETFSNSVNILDEDVLNSTVTEWEVTGNQTIKVVIEGSMPSA